MKNKFSAKLLALFAVVALSGCATQFAPSTNAKEAGVNALSKMFSEPSYNFDANIKVNKVSGIFGEQKGDKDEEFYADIAKSFSLQITGSIDRPKSRLELIPVISFNSKNVESVIKIPLLIEGNPNRVLVDPSALAVFLKGLKPYSGKFVELPIESWLGKTEPLFNYVSDEQIKKTYANFDEKSFSFQPLNDLDKKWGATSKVRITFDKKQIIATVCSLTKIDKHSEHCLLDEGMLSDIQLKGQNNMDISINGAGHVVGLQMLTSAGSKDSKQLPQLVKVTAVLHLYNFGSPNNTINPSKDQIVKLDKNMSLDQLLDGRKH